MKLEDFTTLARTRRSVRQFDPHREIPSELLHELLDCAHWAPSGYNLQPTHFIIVTDPELKKELTRACMNQRHIQEASATIVFVGDRRVYQNNLDAILQSDREAGAIDETYEKIVRQYAALGFNHTPLGLGWLWKALLPPLVRRFVPIPSIPAVHKRYWLAKQVMLSAMQFMLAAHAADLATVPMEGFSESHVRRILKLPRHLVIPVLVSVGYSSAGELIKTRLPLNNLIHFNGW